MSNNIVQMHEVVETSLASNTTVSGVNLITNGSFEQGTNLEDYLPLNPGATNITGWVVTRGQIDYEGNYWEDAEGNRSLDLNGSPGVGGIAQTFNTVAGQTYQVDFSLAGNPEAGTPIKKLKVSAAGQNSPVFSFDTTGFSVDNMGWVNRTWVFTATASTTTLEFYSLSDEPANNRWGPALDNVSVVALSNPGIVLNGTALSDILIGDSGNDTINGKGDSDILKGNGGDDILNGGKDSESDILKGDGGNDILNGGKGADILTGGLGSDSFQFDSKKAGVDTITDFAADADTILLKRRGFGGGLTAGELPSDKFVLGSAAQDSGDRIIYESRTGGIFFDPDGTGNKAPIQFALLQNKPTTITAADFVVF